MKSWRRALTIVAGLTVLAFTAQPVQAIAINVLEYNGNDVQNFSGKGALDFDPSFNNNLPISIEVIYEQRDDATEIAFSGNYIDLSGVPWTDFHITLEDGPTFSRVNDFSTNSSGSYDIALNSDATMASIIFAPSEPDGFVLGKPNAEIDPDHDWSISLNRIMNEGDTFTIHIAPSTVTVPEPATLVLLGGGLLAGAVVRRRNS